VIRRFEAADMEETLRVFRAACLPSHPFLGSAFVEKSENAMRERNLAALDTYVLDDGGIRGFLSHHGPFIDALFVDPEFQSRGLGKQLLDHLKTLLPSIHLTVFAQNPRAVRFYQREQFWAVKLIDHRETGETIVLLKWEKP
jgi:putative acetyltransferase